MDNNVARFFWNNVQSSLNGRTLKFACEKAGLNYRSIANRKSGMMPSLPRLESAYVLAKELEVSLEYLLTGDEPQASRYSEYLPYIERLAETSPAELGAVRKILGMPSENENQERKIFSVSMKEVN